MNQERKNLLVFGYGLGIIAAFFGIGGYLRHGAEWAPVVLIICSIIFFATAAFNYRAFIPGYTGWMKVAHCIGMVVTTLILSSVFFFIFTPIGLFFRLVRKDHLDRTLRPNAQSYWIHRTRAYNKDDYHQQF